MLRSPLNNNGGEKSVNHGIVLVRDHGCETISGRDGPDVVLFALRHLQDASALSHHCSKACLGRWRKDSRIAWRWASFWVCEKPARISGWVYGRWALIGFGKNEEVCV